MKSDKSRNIMTYISNQFIIYQINLLYEKISQYIYQILNISKFMIQYFKHNVLY